MQPDRSAKVIPFPDRRPVRLDFIPKPNRVTPALIIAALIGAGFVLGLMVKGL
jgi:hypothetical protein